MNRSALLSPCGRYRYILSRQWGPGGLVAFVCLNPSVADGTVDDPTVRRCVGFAQQLGYGALMLVNLFAYRATKPSEMLAAKDPIGPDNDKHLVAVAKVADLTVAAWGAYGSHMGRDAAVRAVLPRLHCLRLTKGGHPGHPLYLPYSAAPMAWPAKQPG